MTLTQKEPTSITIGTTSVSKVFVGTTQVRPSGGPTPLHSYDFRNKTQARLEADGWTVYTPYNSDSDGYYCSPPGALTRAIPSLTNAKKVTVEAELYLTSGNRIGSVGVSINDGGSNSIWGFVSGNTSSEIGTAIFHNGTLGSWSGQYAVSGNALLTLEINLQTYGITSTVVNNGNNQTATATATSSEISAIRAGHNFTTYPDSSSHRLKSVLVTVEY